MGIAQIAKLARMAKSFVRNHSTAVQLATVGTVTAGMWGGIFLIEKSASETTKRTIDAGRSVYNVPEGQIVLEEGTISEPGHHDYKKDYTEQFVRYGEQADTIGNVVFAKGLVKDVSVEADAGLDLDFSPHGDTRIFVALSDGCGIEFAPQYATNKARVTKRDNVLVFEGINRMYFGGADGKPHKYKFFGCQGCVNTSNRIDGDEVISGHRRMPDGTVQKSSLYLVDKSVHESKEKDVYHVTENDEKFN